VFVVAGTKVEVAALASVILVGVGSSSHCCGGHDSLERCSGLFRSVGMISASHCSDGH
jgi:hypothetical protein